MRRSVFMRSTWARRSRAANAISPRYTIAGKLKDLAPGAQRVAPGVLSFTPTPRYSRYLFRCARRAFLGRLHRWKGNVMQHMQVTVRYREDGEHAHFRAEMTKSAPIIASITRLVRNMWRLHPDSALATSIYLFDSEAAARHFLAGPTLEHLLNGPDVSGVAFDLAHVDEAHLEIGVPAIAPAPESRAAS